MKSRTKLTKILTGVLLTIAVGLFCMQAAYLLFHTRFEVEYTDLRLFYVINIIIVVCLTVSLFLVFRMSKIWKIILPVLAVGLMTFQIVMMMNQNDRVHHVVSLSPDLKQMLVLKEDVETGQSTYYRTRYGLFARPQENLPYETKGDFKVKWLEDDVAAVTYQAADGTLHQYIGTYGYRDSGISYSYVSSSLSGKWRGENVQVTTTPEGIIVEDAGKPQLYPYDDIVQFGTLAIVLTNQDEAEWTIALNENFASHSNDPDPPEGEITLYEASMEENEPVTLEYAESPEF
ncbi:hypothetical protein [Halobacillus massiliensis]|uniref:hypothetical protein n=1 Tax=Halobacillus massiliensis TaxID=1926286 RepID=UPI0009E29934|nr:hypothetical protein [Halobacillus massiliensis]